MIATARELGIKHIPCYAHRLQSVINAAILSTTPPPPMPELEVLPPEELPKRARPPPPPTKKERYDHFMAQLASLEFGELDKYAFLLFHFCILEN